MNLRTCQLSLLSTVFCLATAAVCHAQPTSKPAEIMTRWGDQGDGTFVNPVIPGDYSDIDAIRVGDDYYAISSTLHLSPAMVVMHSKDMVNWQTIGHAIQDTTQIGPEMNWDRMSRYGRGTWAGAIRHHAGKFWIYFGAPEEGIFMTTATDPAGPWEPLHLVWKTPGYNDTCPFWDDDGQAYLITTHFARDPATGRNYNIHLFKMTPDGKSLVMESDKIIHQSRGSEASKLYKFNGTYYHFYSEVKSEGRVTMMNRSRSLDGPWETRQLNHVSRTADNEPNQGGIMQAPNGSWWFLTHQGSGYWAGRTLSLLPVNWIDGWPIIGKPGPDGIGNMVWREKKPIEGHPVLLPQTNDEFDGAKLGLQWEWNHHPRAEKWSLKERPGFLRLHAFKPLRPGEFNTAGNTISQRALRTEANEVTVKLDLSGMADGQEAGLCHFAGAYAAASISQTGAARKLAYTQRGRPSGAPVEVGDTLYLRSTWGFDGLSQFAYSTDGQTFTPLGTPWQLTWGNYRGDRIGLFTYNNTAEAGHLDIDWFHYTFTTQTGATQAAATQP